MHKHKELTKTCKTLHNLLLQLDNQNVVLSMAAIDIWREWNRSIGLKTVFTGCRGELFLHLQYKQTTYHSFHIQMCVQIEKHRFQGKALRV